MNERFRISTERAVHRGDDPAISRLLDELYAVISFEEGGEPDWAGLESVFSPHARITRITPEGTDHVDRSSFLAFTQNMVELGAYTSFYEFELARASNASATSPRYGASTRRAAIAMRTARSDASVNSIQLIREHGRWRRVV